MVAVVSEYRSREESVEITIVRNYIEREDSVIRAVLAELEHAWLEPDAQKAMEVAAGFLIKLDSKPNGHGQAVHSVKTRLIGDELLREVLPHCDKRICEMFGVSLYTHDYGKGDMSPYLLDLSRLRVFKPHEREAMKVHTRLGFEGLYVPGRPETYLPALIAATHHHTKPGSFVEGGMVLEPEYDAIIDDIEKAYDYMPRSITETLMLMASAADVLQATTRAYVPDEARPSFDSLLLKNGAANWIKDQLIINRYPNVRLKTLYDLTGAIARRGATLNGNGH